MEQHDAKMETIETRVSICYLLVCFSSVDFVSFLIASMHNTNDYFIIHCDKKSPPELKSYVAYIASLHPNIVILPSQSYSWAGFSHVQVSLDAISVATSTWPCWSHFFFLSEQHLPLKSPDYIAKTLVPNKTFAVTRSVADMWGAERSDIENRVSVRFRELPGVGCFAEGLPNETINVTSFHMGSNWIAICRDHCLLLLRSYELGDFDYFKQVVHAEELAIQTILAPFKSDICNIDPLLVAAPHLTDNHHLEMTDPLFFESTKSDYLFIRKRQKILSKEVIHFVKNNNFDENFIKYVNLVKKPSKLSDSLVHNFSEFRQNLEIDSIKSALTLYTNVPVMIAEQKLAPTPRVHFVITSPAFDESLSVRLISEDLATFKICLVHNSVFAGVFKPHYVSQNYLHSTIRARLYGLFGCEDILPLIFDNAGFILRSVGQEDRLADDIAKNVSYFVNEAVAYSSILASA